jgi:hypothetical protein
VIVVVLGLSLMDLRTSGVEVVMTDQPSTVHGQPGHDL